MSVWGAVVGQEAVVAELQQACRRAETPGGHPGHAWLFTGPPGSGRSVAARVFASALLCPEGGCGACHGCHTLKTGTNPDVTVVATERLRIQIAEVRDLVQLAQRHPSGGKWRVVLIEDADRMEERTANVLLKAIEEPSPRTVWLLCAPSPQDVLVTIRSRCRAVRLRIPPTRAVADLLTTRDQIDPELALVSARAAQSHIGRAKRLATDSGARARRDSVVRMPFQVSGLGSALACSAELVSVANDEADAAMLERNDEELAALRRTLGVDSSGPVPVSVRSQLTALAKEQKSRTTRFRRDVLDRALVDLLTVYRDVLITQLGADSEPVNPDLAGQVAQLAERSTPVQTVARIDAVSQARRRLESNVNPQLALDAMAVRLGSP